MRPLLYLGCFAFVNRIPIFSRGIGSGILDFLLQPDFLFAQGMNGEGTHIVGMLYIFRLIQDLDPGQIGLGLVCRLLPGLFFRLFRGKGNDLLGIRLIAVDAHRDGEFHIADG